ncbi:glycoside hydrolase, family 57 [Thermofilum pendens Hrk 5]|uniref:Glycoside hydrolase, family 57 n=1 Tax=Thermofilum pendens (strain DSM 2475 / Hrk 5) TaxID=368408 RepID=A1RYB3_THEPD|nr:glycoside hydrolase, family 57 [Thermofilum pendens Hrk 5]
MTLHFSGPLLMYWRELYPDFLARLRETVSRSEFEVLGGTYSESVLSLLPWEDRVLQLKKGRELVEETLGVSPRGLWIPERVWDPTLPPAISEAGYSYVIVDDEVGYRSGLWKDDVHRAVLTEYSGRRVGVLFIDGPVRYILPWKAPGEVLGYIRSFATEDGRLYVLWGSDAEKFGEWWDARAAEQWLRTFFGMLKGDSSVALLTPSEYILRHGYQGLAYLAPGSYDKMMEWSGGYFPNFLRKYRETNNMHKKMLYVRGKLSLLKASREAWEEYLKAQCNDAYWHGLFGGVYIPFLRQAVFEHLVRAERLAEEESGYYLGNSSVVRSLDFDFDGVDEVLIEEKEVNAYVKPSDGGSLFELDVKMPGKEHNLLATMSRYREPYLEDQKSVVPDWYRRVAFREHIWRKDASSADWINNTPFVDVSDFALGNYIVEAVEGNKLVLSFTGRDWSDRRRPARIHLVKTYEVLGSQRTVRVRYRWRNMERRFIDPKLSVEVSLFPRLSYEEDSDPTYTVDGSQRLSVREGFSSPWARTVRVESPAFPTVTVESSRHAEVWVSPILSWYRTEKGLRSEYQGLAVSFNYAVALNPGETFETEVSLSW